MTVAIWLCFTISILTNLPLSVFCLFMINQKRNVKWICSFCSLGAVSARATELLQTAGQLWNRWTCSFSLALLIWFNIIFPWFRFSVVEDQLKQCWSGVSVLKFILDVNSHIALSHSPGEDIIFSSVTCNPLYSHLPEILSVMRQRANKSITEYFSCKDSS